MHAFLLEFGISMPKGIAIINGLSTVLTEHAPPPYLAQLLLRLQAHYRYLAEQITEIETALMQEVMQDETGQRLMTIRGISPMTASALSSQLEDGKQYARSRDFAASTGLVSPTIQYRRQDGLVGYQQAGR
ncbi:transposase [Xenorhabdus szentirmaii]|nr:transposase [Xenorhabdus szentirmaii DSM 16338]PHM43833.1 transposase [Xenorhabdus szentirmaii]